MKNTKANSIVNLIIALAVVALLTACTYFALFGIAFTVVGADDWAGAVLNMAMGEHTEQVMGYYQLHRDYGDVEENEIPNWAKEELAAYEAIFNPETTNFRFEVFAEDGTVLFGNYSGEPYLARSYDWEQHLAGTEIDRQRLEAYERNWAYDYKNNVSLHGVGSEVYPVDASQKMPEEYKYYDAYGNYYNANGDVIAYNGANYDENGNFIGEVISVVTPTPVQQYLSIEVDGVTYHAFDRRAGYPEEFVYYDDAGDVYDADLNYIMNFDEYYAMGNGETETMSTPRPTPTPRPQVTQAPATKPAATPKPEIVELEALTAQEYDALYDACYEETTIRGYIPKEMTVEDAYSALYARVMEYADMKDEYMENAIGSGIAALILLLVMLALAGRTDEKTGEYVAVGFGRMPWDLWAAAMCGLAILAGCTVYVAAELTVEAFRYGMGFDIAADLDLIDLAINGCVAVGAMCIGLAVGALYSLAARVKVKGWLRNCLCWKLWLWCRKWCVKICKWLWKLWLRIWRGTRNAFVSIPLIWKAAVLLGGIGAVEFIFYAANAQYGDGVFLALLWHIVRFLILMIICLMLKRLQQGARTIADGDLEHRIDTKNLFLDIRAHAECLNRIGEGLSHSVDARLRSERMKTELITNVSHDLKTPLTSIVNYVDLLKKENLEGTAAEYVEVLDRQAARLKKLTEDLVEASKASSGALQVSVERVSLTELLEQAQAEYAVRLQESALQPVIRQPEGEVMVWADGRYLWRILDNLLSNVCKYAMHGTRVYLELRTEGDNAVLSVKNVSREGLNISAEELMERFVRGDASRNTEGSGLGLSIAQNLAKLMGGELRVTIDGDLFKADVILPMAK